MMTDIELSKLLKWAESSTQALHFAFGISSRDREGVLILHKHHKGPSILHDLVKSEADELKSRAYGTVAVSSTDAAVTFSTYRAVSPTAQKSVQRILKKTKVRSYNVVFAEAGNGDSEYAGGE